MGSLIAETSRIDPQPRLAEDVIVGPGCVIGPEVEIGRATHLIGHVCLMGPTTLGQFNTVGPYAAIGGEPQDLSYWGSPTRVEIGDRNTIQERVTIHRASEKENGVTRIGSNNRLLAGAHIAHDCQLGDGITLGAGSMLAGHVHIESHAIISDKAALLQFVTCGGFSFVGGQTKISQDVPPYMLVDGNPPSIRGLNLRGKEAAELGGEALVALRKAHHLIYEAKMPLVEVAAVLEQLDYLTPEVVHLLRFLESQHEGRLGRARDRRRGS